MSDVTEECFTKSTQETAFVTNPAYTDVTPSSTIPENREAAFVTNPAYTDVTPSTIPENREAAFVTSPVYLEVIPSSTIPENREAAFATEPQVPSDSTPENSKLFVTNPSYTKVTKVPSNTTPSINEVEEQHINEEHVTEDVSIAINVVETNKAESRTSKHRLVTIIIILISFFIVLIILLFTFSGTIGNIPKLFL